MRLALTLSILITLGLPVVSHAQATSVAVPVDSDRDGMSDALEQSLLEQFAPTFMVGRHDCSEVPAEFTPGLKVPTVEHEDGTIYGQVSPVKSSTAARPVAEIHYFHLWKRDCGAHGHPLDTEHVAVLVHGAEHDGQMQWSADYWYAAAHEDTLCDVSQITRASTLHAEGKGPQVWISPGKHASSLNLELCQRGCGADRCVDMVALPTTGLINLGEAGAPMNGSVFIPSKAWPLEAKMTHTNFPAEALARVDALPASDIAWFSTGRHPVQGVIARSYATEQTIAGGGHNTDVALSVASDSTGDALSTAGSNTESALGTGYHKTTHALGKSLAAVGHALTPRPKPDTPQ